VPASPPKPLLHDLAHARSDMATPESAPGRDKPGGDGPPQWFAMAGMATVGMTAVRIGSWTVSDLLFLASSLMIVLRLLTGSRRHLAPVVARRTSPALLIGIAVLTVGALLATVYRSFAPAESLEALVRVWYITIIWFWTVRSVSSSVRTFRRLLLAAIIGAVAHSLVGIYQDVSGLNAGSPGWGRSRGLGDHYGDFGISVGSFVPILAVWRPAAKATARREMWRLGAILILVAGVGASGSMTPVGALIIGTIVALVLPKLASRAAGERRRIVVPVLAAIAAIVLVMTGTVDLPVQTRFEELTAGDTDVTGSAQSRVDMARVAVDGVVDSPLVGVGFDGLSGGLLLDDGASQIHSFYFRIAFEAGILGLLGLLIILFVIHRQGWQLLRYTAGGSVAWLPAGVMGSVTMVLTSAMFGPVLYGRLSWLPIALVNALYGLGRAGLLAPYRRPVRRRGGQVGVPVSP
jgi:hypothetical protein